MYIVPCNTDDGCWDVVYGHMIAGEYWSTEHVAHYPTYEHAQRFVARYGSSPSYR